MTDTKTYPVHLDETRHLRFNNTALRLLDRELTQLYGHSFAHYVQQLGDEMGEDVMEPNIGAINNDVMCIALKYALRHEMPGVGDQKVDNIIDEARDRGETDALVEAWAAIMEAWIDASPFGLEEASDDTVAPEGKEAAGENPYESASGEPSRTAGAGTA